MPRSELVRERIRCVDTSIGFASECVKLVGRSIRRIGECIVLVEERIERIAECIDDLAACTRHRFVSTRRSSGRTLRLVQREERSIPSAAIFMHPEATFIHLGPTFTDLEATFTDLEATFILPGERFVHGEPPLVCSSARFVDIDDGIARGPVAPISHDATHRPRRHCVRCPIARRPPSRSP